VVADPFVTCLLEDAMNVPAPDGSTVRPLCRLTGLGSFAHFQLEPGGVSEAVSHATVQEIWYVIGGAGEMWRRQAGREDVVALRSGVCLTIPLGSVFQFRAAEGADPCRSSRSPCLRGRSRASTRPVLSPESGRRS
jgi:hypothetical protein